MAYRADRGHREHRLGRAAHGCGFRLPSGAVASIVLAIVFGCATREPPPPAPLAAQVPSPAAKADDAPPTADAVAPRPGPEVGGDVLVFSCDELFLEGSADLTETGRARLRALAADLSAGVPERVVVRVHTDDDGSIAFNYALSDERAEAVRIELVAGGLDAARVRARGLGPRYPIAANDTPEGRVRNRRVTVETRPSGWQPAGVAR